MESPVAGESRSFTATSLARHRRIEDREAPLGDVDLGPAANRERELRGRAVRAGLSQVQPGEGVSARGRVRSSFSRQSRYSSVQVTAGASAPGGSGRVTVRRKLSTV